MDAEVDFWEFQEAVAALACYKFPSPYLTLERRIAMFIGNFFTKYEQDAVARKKKLRRNRALVQMAAQNELLNKLEA